MEIDNQKITNAKWMVQELKCSICGHKWIAVIEMPRSKFSSVNLQCPKCTHMSGVEDEEDE